MLMNNLKKYNCSILNVPFQNMIPKKPYLKLSCSGIYICPICNGSGKKHTNLDDIFCLFTLNKKSFNNKIVMYETCKRCDGKGYV